MTRILVVKRVDGLPVPKPAINVKLATCKHCGRVQPVTAMVNGICGKCEVFPVNEVRVIPEFKIQ